MKPLSIEPLSHKPKADPEWNESYYFVFYDRRNSIGGMTRLGFKPNKQEGSTFLILFLPDGSRILYRHQERITDHTWGKSMKVGGVVHQPRSTGRWNYLFEGNMLMMRNNETLHGTRGLIKSNSNVLKVKLNLSFNPISDVYEYSEHMTAESRQLGRKAGDAHWEQIGKVNGKIRLDNYTFYIQETMGQRDHTHGVRDWTEVGDWLYYVVWFSKNYAVNPAAIITDDGRVSTGGFIFKNGENIPIKSIRVLEQKFQNNVFPTSSKLELVDKLGQHHTLEGEAGPIVPIPFIDEKGQLSILTQSFGRFKMDKVSGGYGLYETLRRAEDPEETAAGLAQIYGENWASFLNRPK